MLRSVPCSMSQRRPRRVRRCRRWFTGCVVRSGSALIVAPAEPYMVREQRARFRAICPRMRFPARCMCRAMPTSRHHCAIRKAHVTSCRCEPPSGGAVFGTQERAVRLHDRKKRK
jgi:hypothetical protein